MARDRTLRTADDYLKAYPRLTAHIICHSLGYATPTTAAAILMDAHERRENWCEWLYSCYDRNARRALQDAIRGRHHHHGYMAEYALAKALVDRVNAGGNDGTWLASRF